MSDKKIRHNEQQFKQKVFSKLAEDGETFGSFHDVFAHFRSYDPSRTGSYTTWLIKTYCEGGFLFEDLGKAKETLQWFDEAKHRLPVERRNIADYPTLADVWKAVKPFVEKHEKVEPSKREQRRKEQEEVYAETVFLEEADDYRIVVPLTIDASKWWGKGTRWCTSAEDNNMFIQYFKKAPLIIIDFKDGHKWQFLSSEYDLQFMDEDDREVHPKYVFEKWDILKKIFLMGVKFNTGIEKYIPFKMKNSDIYLDFLKSNNAFFGNIPFGSRTIEHYVEALKNPKTVSEALKNIPTKLQTPAIYDEAITCSGKMLRQVPLKHRTKELCSKAIKIDGDALEYVPDGLKTHDLCLEAVKSHGWALYYVPEDRMTYDVCFESVKHDDSTLSFIPAEHKTYELCLESVKHDGTTLRFVPDRLLTPELCLEAVKNNGNSIFDVPSSIRTQSFYYEVSKYAEFIKGYEAFFHQIPKEYLTYEICLGAVKRHRNLLGSIPLEFRTKELCLEAVKSTRRALAHVPTEFEDSELWNTVVNSHFLSLGEVPIEHRSLDVCLSAIRQGYARFEDIPIEFITPEICLEHVRSTGNIHFLIPEEFKSKDFLKKCRDLIHQKCIGYSQINNLDQWIEYYHGDKNSLSMTRNI